MDVSFNIPRAGPLSQISVHIISFEAATWLATGAIGWWKARERSLTLTEILSARKTSLVSTSSFNYAEYREIRKYGSIVGLSAQKGALCRLPEAVESTAVTENAGIDCLRALATGLLCFYSEQLTSSILADIIPYGLLQSEQDDHDWKFDGPIIASLGDWVKAVAAEEDCNNFRQRLLQKVSEDSRNLDGLNVIPPNDGDGYNELGLLLGCLRWMVTPLHRRDLLKYPTRSIRVWTTMAIMSRLGFDVSIFLNAVQSKEQYDEILNPPYEDNYSDVVLITSAVGKTDPWIVTENVYQTLQLRPQIYPLLSIPYAAFGQLQRQYGLVDAAELTDIWKVCFRHAKSAVTMPTLSRGGKVLLNLRSSDYNIYREGHKALIGLWSPHLSRIMRPAFDDYLPTVLDGDWSPEAFKAFYDGQRSGERIYLEDVEVLRNFCRLTSIVLGTIYGACSVALSTQVPDNRTDQLGDEALEVAFSPDIVMGNKPFAWAAKLGSALSGFLEQSEWVGLLLELVTGAEPPQPLNEQPSEALLGNINLTEKDVFNRTHVRISDIMGIQANGIFAVSEFVLRPSSDGSTSLLFHVGVGRILDVPIDQSGYVRSSLHEKSAVDLNLNPEPELCRLSFDSSSDDSGMRIDAEPYWRNDPQRICFAVRRDGALLATLSIVKVLEKIIACDVKCTCDSPPREVPVPRSERWHNVTVNQFHQTSIPEPPKVGISFRDRDRILVNAGGNEVCRIYAAGILVCRKMVICRDCISCALDAARKGKNNLNAGATALIVG